jgi:hypothetical protein
MSAFTDFINNPLYVSIFVILITSLVGFYVNSRVRDRCLRDFDGYAVTIEHGAGTVVWGRLRTYSAGLELVYAAVHRDREGHDENSYILYGSEMGGLQAVYRFHDDQSPRNQRRREADIRRTYKPTIFRRTRRALRNIFSTFRDAIVQTTNALLGRRMQQTPQSTMTGQYQQLTSSGAQLLSGTFGNAYEPILERYIGQYVVLEIARGDTVEEEYGILKEYSAKYVELLNVKVEVPLKVYQARQADDGQAEIGISPCDSLVRVTNPLPQALLVEAIVRDGSERSVEVPVPAGGSAEIQLADDEVGQAIELRIGVRRIADLVVPRTIALIRHAGRRETLSLEELLGLDDLPGLPWVRRLFGEREKQVANLPHPVGGSPGPTAPRTASRRRST